MRGRTLLAAIALVICLPILVAALGTSQRAGLVIGVVLVVIGVGASLLGAGRGDGADR